MYSEPEIVSTASLQTRAYVKLYIDGKRYRYYNGKIIGISCNPNHAKTVKERHRALITLCYNLKRQLDAGWRPNNLKESPLLPEPRYYIGEKFTLLLSELQKQDISKLYKRDIVSVGDSFLAYISEKKILNIECHKIDSTIIEDFLKRYNHSAVSYMNKRRTLGSIFSRLVKQKAITDNPVYGTSRLKEKATLHQAYTKQQLRVVLGYLKENNPKLYLCAMLMYGCLLRPHQEIRQLCWSDFNSDYSSISLNGKRNKSKRIRTVHVPGYVQEVLQHQSISGTIENVNLFTGMQQIFNDSYFNTMWSRVKSVLLKNGLITEKHTLYSFRHTAAINLYLKTKDPFKVQQALGHTSMTVTLTYMRSLGILNAVTAEDVPDL